MFKVAIPLSVISVKQYPLFHVVRCQECWINIAYILILTVITQFLFGLKCATKPSGSAMWEEPISRL